MSKRLMLVGLICLALGSRAAADSLVAQFFPLSGEIRFQNPNATAVRFVYYSISSISSHSGALNPTSPPWQSISDFYDVSGNGFIDPSQDWTKISATSTQLAEGVFAGSGGSLLAHRSVSLGAIWNPNVVAWTDLYFNVLQDTQVLPVFFQLAVDGDYNHNGTVDSADYIIWRQKLGSTTSLDADGDINGIVDAGDYDIWRRNFGSSLFGSGSSLPLDTGQSLLQPGGGVPEPASVTLALLALTAFLFSVRARRAA